jgi:hypothetical protein
LVYVPFILAFAASEVVIADGIADSSIWLLESNPAYPPAMFLSAVSA